MPHKHTRKGEDKSTVDLPPTIIAKPLPVTKSAKSNGIFTTEVTAVRKRKRGPENNDDTPKAFARLMSFRDGKKLPKGLDDGLKPNKRQRRAEVERTPTQEAESKNPQTELPTIKPGEKMSDFAARVDAALPLSGLMNKTTKGGKDPLGLKAARTKKERKMHRMYDEWREQDRKIKEKRQEALELAAEAAEEADEELGVKWKIDMEATDRRDKKKGRQRKSKILGEVDDGFDDDPWAAVAKARNEGPKKLNDVAQAPPQFSKVPKEKLQAQRARANVEGVPKAAGSLRRREDLVEVRKSVVEGYRQMMRENKAASR